MLTNAFPYAIIAMFTLAAISDLYHAQYARSAFYALSAAINVTVLFMKG